MGRRVGRAGAGRGGDDEFAGDDLAQNADTRELIGLGSDNEDDYEFQDDEEDIHVDMNNVRFGEEELTESEEEEEEEDDDDDEAAAALRRLEEAALGDDEEEDGLGGGGGGEAPSAKRGKLSVKDLEKRFERPAAGAGAGAASGASASTAAAAAAAAGGSGRRRRRRRRRRRGAVLAPRRGARARATSARA